MKIKELHFSDGSHMCVCKNFGKPHIGCEGLNNVLLESDARKIEQKNGSETEYSVRKSTCPDCRFLLFPHTGCILNGNLNLFQEESQEEAVTSPVLIFSTQEAAPQTVGQ